MTTIEKISLDDLEPISQVEGKIVVKVSRKWKDYSYNNNGQQGGVNMILIDEFHKRIYAWIPPNCISKINEYLVEGHTYEIQNFVFAPFTSRNKCFQDNRHIIFSYLSIVTALRGSYSLIPEHIFHFTTLGNIDDMGVEDNYCIDVVGIIYSVKALEVKTNRKNEEKTILDLVITDTISKVNIHFRGDFAVTCNVALSNAALQPLQPVIIILSSCIVIHKSNATETCLTNGPETDIFINPNNIRMQNLRNRIVKHNFQKLDEAVML